MEASGNDDLLTSLGVLSVGSYVPEFPQKASLVFVQVSTVFKGFPPN